MILKERLGCSRKDVDWGGGKKRRSDRDGSGQDRDSSSWGTPLLKATPSDRDTIYSEIWAFRKVLFILHQSGERDGLEKTGRMGTRMGTPWGKMTTCRSHLQRVDHRWD